MLATYFEHVVSSDVISQVMFAEDYTLWVNGDSSVSIVTNGLSLPKVVFRYSAEAGGYFPKASRPDRELPRLLLSSYRGFFPQE
jgi:hypothetical protein